MCAAGTVALIQGMIYDGSIFPMVGMQLILAAAALVTWQGLRQKV
jgi:hypothetical protein